MKKISGRKLSILGLVLLGVSAVAAAVTPSNKKDSTSFVVHSCTESNDGCEISCATTDVASIQCIDTNSTGVLAMSGSTGELSPSQSNCTTDCGK